MRLRHVLCASLLVAPLIVTAGTSAAHAANLGTWSFTGTWFSQDGGLTGTNPLTLSGEAGDTFTITNSDSGFGGVTLTNATGQVSRSGSSCSGGGCNIARGTSSTFTLVSSGNLSLTGGTTTNPATITLTVSGGGSTGSNTSAVPAPVFTLTTSQTTTCSVPAVTGDSGTWVPLPKASECTPPAPHAGATLLGWSTVSDFPVAIAQRQVDRGWGAYELIDSNGVSTGVFIPAGGYALLSASTTLIPVWSK